MMLTCELPPCDGQQYPGRDEKAWKAHVVSHHGPDVTRFSDLAVGGDWRTRAIDAVKRLAAARIEFTFYDVAKLAGEPLNPQSDWGRFAQEVVHLGLAHPVGYQQSDRPTTKGSAVRTWRAGPTPTRQETSAA